MDITISKEELSALVNLRHCVHQYLICSSPRDLPVRLEILRKAYRLAMSFLPVDPIAAGKIHQQLLSQRRSYSAEINRQTTPELECGKHFGLPPEWSNEEEETNYGQYVD